MGIEQSRARIVREVAGRASRLEQIMAMGRADACARLEAVKGVGPWTSAQVMGAAWGDRDSIPIGDFHLPHTVAWALAGEPRGSDDRMLDLLEAYRPQRRRALLLIKMAGIRAPRYGPRSPKSVITRGGSF
jgi:3-methyladenine DNA glycosylase/8-oxoguanine DNA glycosylase